MNVAPTSLPEVLLVEPKLFGDRRGYFFESFNAGRYADHGIASTFVQDNVSFSRGGVLRGLHLQNPHAQDKLVYVLDGEVFDVAVDMRAGSPRFGRWAGERLSGENARQLFIPAGFAHGFCVLSETVLFAYKCSDFYAPGCEVTIAWNDPDIGIAWPLAEPSLSEKDQRGVRLRELADGALMPYHEAE